jgi:hypothetical protein
MYAKVGLQFWYLWFEQNAWLWFADMQMALQGQMDVLDQQKSCGMTSTSSKGNYFNEASWIILTHITVDNDCYGI